MPLHVTQRRSQDCTDPAFNPTDIQQKSDHCGTKQPHDHGSRSPRWPVQMPPVWPGQSTAKRTSIQTDLPHLLPRLGNSFRPELRTAIDFSRYTRIWRDRIQTIGWAQGTATHEVVFGSDAVDGVDERLNQTIRHHMVRASLELSRVLDSVRSNRSTGS